ncbi:MAG: metallophosphoesterase [Bacilli bacterium]|nr:metallophosphoesterase [Bacilli bacterium]MBN2876303.1 metallophosphoesterase [Bacilli bacterium]
MKKLLLVFLLIFMLNLISCGQDSVTVYTDDEPITLEMQHDTLKILQLTDIHLTYGVDAFDRKTLDEIQTLVQSDDFDLIVISGDMVLSPFGPALFGKLVRFMERLETPWTFVFGNHETDYSDYTDYLRKLQDTEYLYFKVGPEMDQGGYGNFRIVFTQDGIPFYSIYLLDSHAERENYTDEEGEYDYLKESQVDWYVSHVSSDTTDSIMFFHIPLREYIDATGYEGFFLEKVCPQGVNTGMFDAITTYERTTGVFVGHDHLNDFSLVMDDVLLAYGQITGYSAYGNLDRGGRVIEISSGSVMSSYILLEKDVIS